MFDPGVKKLPALPPDEIVVSASTSSASLATDWHSARLQLDRRWEGSSKARASEHYLAVLKASYDYDPDPGADEAISAKEGQLLLLKERIGSEWWMVKIKGDPQEEYSPVGLVPAAYVEPADYTSVVKALYDYEARAPGELSITEGQILLAFDTEEEWLLVQTDEDGGKAGFVPANYVEPHSEEEAAPAPQIVVADSPPKPAHVDPAARVASTKIKSDDMEIWPVSEVDRKGKKKKGALGVGHGAVFFASASAPYIFRIFTYSPKTLLQKWQTVHIQNIAVEKSTHVHIDVGGPNAVNLHFCVGSKDNANTIVAKLESSKQLSAPSPAASPALESSIVVPAWCTEASRFSSSLETELIRLLGWSIWRPCRWM
ncbi:hypothetical protein DFH06DRAFT_991671 [Mycena polygramma]|nr:hypothetical protein DFH06DRAFT_991671 [Mycena polygramma]